MERRKISKSFRLLTVAHPLYARLGSFGSHGCSSGLGNEKRGYVDILKTRLQATNPIYDLQVYYYSKLSRNFLDGFTTLLPSEHLRACAPNGNAAGGWVGAPLSDLVRMSS